MQNAFMHGKYVQLYIMTGMQQMTRKSGVGHNMFEKGNSGNSYKYASSIYKLVTERSPILWRFLNILHISFFSAMFCKNILNIQKFVIGKFHCILVDW